MKSPGLRRFKVTLEYDGTRYSGWQIQKDARTVQGELFRSIRTGLKNEEFEFMGSGRTDAGVHALQQVAHLQIATMLAPEIIRMKINDELPPDINILGVEKVQQNFHARHDAVSRSYLYQVSRRRTAFGKRFVWWVKDRLDFADIQRAAQLFVGMKNMRSFTADEEEEKPTTVLIDSIDVRTDGDLILIRITGSHFLWKLVRRIVGVLIEVGRGKMNEKLLRRFLLEDSSEPARYTAPPSGLFLEFVSYKKGVPMPEFRPVMNISGAGTLRTDSSTERR